MRDHLISYVDLLFAGAPHASDIKQEILQNTLDRYDDLIAQGKSPEAAYQLAISGIGDIQELLSSQPAPIPQPAVSTVSGKKASKPLWKILLLVIGICLVIALVGTVIAGTVYTLFAVDSSYSTASDTVDVLPEEVRNIEIEWAAGSVSIAAADVETLTFHESGALVEAQPMVWKQDGDTLVVRYSAANFTTLGGKDLTVLFPRDWICGELELNMASADATVEELLADKVSLDTASGACSFFDCTIYDLDMDTASGNVRYEGALYTLDYDAASGKFNGVFKNMPAKINTESASGDVNIIVPIEFGFRAKLDTASGSFQCNLPMSFDGNYYVYGDGEGSFEFESASGDVVIKGAE